MTDADDLKIELARATMAEALHTIADDVSGLPLNQAAATLDQMRPLVRTLGDIIRRSRRGPVP